MGSYNNGGGGSGITQQQLDAAIKMVSFTYRSGKWYDSRHNRVIDDITNSTSPSRNNEAHSVEFFVQGKHTFDGIGIDANGSASGPCSARLWIMDDDNGMPGNLIIESAVFDMEPDGVKELDITPTELSGRIWLGYACNLTSRSVGAFAATSSSGDETMTIYGFGNVGGTSKPYASVMSYSLGSVGSEQSAPAAWVNSFNNTTSAPRIMLRAT